jgi:hypothetical protein
MEELTNFSKDERANKATHKDFHYEWVDLYSFRY